MNRKITKAEAGYQGEPKVTKRCGTCSMFRAPDSCTLVMGKIQSYGYCKHWESKK